MIYEFLADGFEEIEALAPVDIMRRADVEIKTVSVTGNREVTGSHGITVLADILFDEMDEKAQMLILPGGMPGTLNLRNFEPLCELLKKAVKEETYIAAICAAPSVFGELGLLKGKKAICYPGFEDKLEGAEIVDNPVVISDNIITSKGAGTAHLFGFALLSLFKGEETAKILKNGMMYD